MEEIGVDALLLSVGADLPYFTGYEAMPLERLTMLVLPADATRRSIVPALEAPRVVERPDVFVTRPWEETDDPDRDRRCARREGRRCRGRRPDLGALRARSPARAPRHAVPQGSDVTRRFAS